jgi:4'-phosphopantetheinyl transferase EntD
MSSPLFECEASVIAKAVPKRQREFRSGRAAARSALAEFGLEQCPIPRDTAGCPIWPSGFVGSISHCEDEAIVIAGRSTDFMGLGIDVEPVLSFNGQALNLVCNDTDRSFRPLSETRLPMPWEYLIFSAKEAFYKAAFPICRIFLDPASIAVVAFPNKGSIRGKFIVIPVQKDLADDALMQSTEGRWAFYQNHLYCSVIIPRGS